VKPAQRYSKTDLRRQTLAPPARAESPARETSVAVEAMLLGAALAAGSNDARQRNPASKKRA